MNRRDKELLNKVGRYYLQYKGVVDIEKLLSLFEGTTEVPVNDYTLSYIYFYIIYLVTKDAVRSAREALKDRLTYKEFYVDYSQELFGELDVPRTLAVYSMNMVAYYNFAESLNAPEYSILGYLLRRIYYLVKEKLEKYESSDDMPKYFNFRKDFKEKYEELNKSKEKFPEGYYREPSYTDPEWLIRAYKAYFLIKGLENIKVGTKEKGVITNNDKKIIKFLFWKLYELYVFYLVVNYLENKGYHIIRKNGEFFAEKGNKLIKLIFNTSLPSSSLRKVDNIEDVDKYKGRPDISLDKPSKPIIFECKYSTSVSYITMGRFKVMAYTYEYDPEVAVLVYPGLKENQVDYDAEDRATRELDQMVRKNEFLLDFYYNSHLIYMAIIDPLRKDEENLRIIDKILGKII